MSEPKNGFIYDGVCTSNITNYSPIAGYQDLSIMTLEETVHDLTTYVPNIRTYVRQAKEKCLKDKKLTHDESAAIYLYTMPTTFHSALNQRLRAESRQELKPWLSYLKLAISALRKLPSLETVLWRAVASHIKVDFKTDFEQTWWTMSSCSRDLETIEYYLGGNGTVFNIKSLHGKDISEYSALPREQEVLLMPGTRVRFTSLPLEIKDKLNIVSFEEW